MGRLHTFRPAWLWLAAFLASPLATAQPFGLEPIPTATAPTGRIAIIIDDLGYNRGAGERAMRLPGAVTLAIIPFSPHAKHLSQAASALGKELMLHVPMEPHNQVPWEAGGLSSELSRSELQLALFRMLEAMPQAAGVNNHMGSKFTEERVSVEWLMEELHQQELFFVDSRTTAASLAWSSAQARGIPSLKRDLFLDNVREAAAIEQQLEKLTALAQRRGYALAIGHPHDVTLDVLEAYLPKLVATGVALVPVSELIKSSELQEPELESAQPDIQSAPANNTSPRDTTSREAVQAKRDATNI